MCTSDLGTGLRDELQALIQPSSANKRADSSKTFESKGCSRNLVTKKAER